MAIGRELSGGSGNDHEVNHGLDVAQKRAMGAALCRICVSVGCCEREGNGYFVKERERERT